MGLRAHTHTSNANQPEHKWSQRKWCKAIVSQRKLLLHCFYDCVLDIIRQQQTFNAIRNARSTKKWIQNAGNGFVTYVKSIAQILNARERIPSRFLGGRKKCSRERISENLRKNDFFWVICSHADSKYSW